MSERFLILSGYTPAGLSNQRMELEIKAALAFLSRRILVLPTRVRAYSTSYDGTTEPTLTDVLQMPQPYLRLSDFRKRYPRAKPQSLPWRGRAASAYFISDSARMLPDKIKRWFANGRKHAWHFDNKGDGVIAYFSGVRMLCWYSYFFLVSTTERRELLRFIGKIRPLSEYSDFANEFSTRVGNYNAIHVRRGDFGSFGIKLPDAKEIIHNLDSLFPKDELMLICTDERDARNCFRPLFENYPQACLIDEILENDPIWRNRCKSLPFYGAIVRALLTQLIAARARLFAGTFYSTFTGFIHRQRLMDRQDPIFRFVANPFPELSFEQCAFLEDVHDGFSWNKVNYRHRPHVHAWMREWPDALNDNVNEN